MDFKGCLEKDSVSGVRPVLQQEFDLVANGHNFQANAEYSDLIKHSGFDIFILTQTKVFSTLPSQLVGKKPVWAPSVVQLPEGKLQSLAMPPHSGFFW